MIEPKMQVLICYFLPSNIQNTAIAIFKNIQSAHTRALYIDINTDNDSGNSPSIL